MPQEENFSSFLMCSESEDLPPPYHVQTQPDPMTGEDMHVNEVKVAGKLVGIQNRPSGKGHPRLQNPQSAPSLP